MSPSSWILNNSQMTMKEVMHCSWLVPFSFGKYFLIHQYSIRKYAAC